MQRQANGREEAPEEKRVLEYETPGDRAEDGEPFATKEQLKELGCTFLVQFVVIPLLMLAAVFLAIRCSR